MSWQKNVYIETWLVTAIKAGDTKPKMTLEIGAKSPESALAKAVRLVSVTEKGLLWQVKKAPPKEKEERTDAADNS